MPENAHFFHHHESFHISDSPSTPASTLGSSHNASPAHHVVGEDVLEDSLFPQLKSDEPNDVEELQKDDPLGVDVWKFYKKQSQLPDAERMQNMTWRMMTINLRNAQRGKSNSILPQKHARTWSPRPSYRTSEPRSSTTHPKSGPARRIAQPRRSNGKPTFPMAPKDGLHTHASSVPDFHFSYPYDSLNPTTTQLPPSHGFDLRSGPRGQVHIPPQSSRSSEQPVFGLQHSRHISQVPAYSTPYYQPGTSPFRDQIGVQQESYADVVGWDPGWANEAFGTQTLYVPPGTTAIKREEVDEEEARPSGMLSSEDWYGQGVPRDFGDPASVQQNFADWQQFPEHHYAELLDGQPKAEGYADFGFGGPMSDAQVRGQHGGVFCDPGAHCVAAGRKRRKW